MKKVYFLLIAGSLTFLGAGCEKDQAVSPTKEDELKFPTEQEYSAFLAGTTPSFVGNHNGNAFSWQLSPGQFQSNTGKCDYPDSLRGINFGLVSEGGENYFMLYFPYYNPNSGDDFNRVYGLGEKKTGDLATDFYLIIKIGNETYETVSSSATNRIEIVKKEEYLLEGLQWENGVSQPYSEKRLRLWFKINTQLSSCLNCPNSNLLVVNGLMLAEVYGYEGSL